MNHFLTAFTAAESSIAQATLTSPPANEQPVSGASKLRATPVKFIASVAANAAGFGLLLAGCWLSVQFLELLITV